MLELSIRQDQVEESFLILHSAGIFRVGQKRTWQDTCYEIHHSILKSKLSEYGQDTEIEGSTNALLLIIYHIPRA